MEFNKCKAGKKKWDALEDLLAEKEQEFEARVAKRLRTSEKFFKMRTDGLSHDLKGGMLLLLWASSNGLSRNVLNCPLFDAYHRHNGINLPPNRHLLQSDYVPHLDKLVVDGMVSRLSVSSFSPLCITPSHLLRKKTLSVSLSADG